MIWLPLAIIAAAAVAWYLRLPTGEELLLQAREAARLGDFAMVERLGKQALWSEPNSSETLRLVARALREQGRLKEAISYLDRLPSDGSVDFVEGRFAAGQINYELGLASDAEACYLAVVSDAPQHWAAHQELALLYTLQGRRWRSVPHLLALVRGDQFTPEQLFLLGDLQRDHEWEEETARLRAAAPDDPTPLIGIARRALHDAQHDEAETLLRQVIKANPESTEAQVLLGWALLSRSDAFEPWQQQVPASVETHPDYWTVLGISAADNGQPRAAIRCFWEAVQRNPNDQTANYRLSQLLLASGEQELAQPFAERARLLERLVSAINTLLPRRHSRAALLEEADTLSQAAELLEELGRYWEAVAYYRLLGRIGAGESAFAAQMEDCLRKLSTDSPQTLASHDPTREVDLASYPLPRQQFARTNSGDGTEEDAVSIRFIDLAGAAGIDFRYDNGHDRPGMRIHQTTGGGVAVLDYDQDGWPDLYFTQGNHWPRDSDQTRADRLYRNLGNGKMVDVTRQAGLGDTGFGQGVAVGDVNNDGFPDLRVATLGTNRLYLNNGDGTFTESVYAGLAGDRWTTSCLVADLNGDHLPDIFDVNYLQYKGSDIDRLCGDHDRVCAPMEFPMEQNQLWLNLGDGRFLDVSDESGIGAASGYGLGVVAASVDQGAGMSLLVANDQSPNLWFEPSATDGGVPTFTEQAVLKGLAVDIDGDVQGCMGIAAGDSDGDGSIDFVVTNFVEESNAVYLGRGGMFVDSARQAGMFDSSFGMVSFGTQFIDADLDGWQDLVVTNGHVDDFASEGDEFKMSAQLFRNVGGKRFVNLTGESLGEFFSRKYLGRGLARVDWNRDGREDAAISHINDPATLLTNQTDNVGHFVAVRLRGTTSARDAVGAVVTLQVDSRSLVRQLTAGDGYHASNQRQLIFGLGDATDVSTLSVRWPSGTTESYASPPVDTECLLIEGHAPAVPIAVD